ncbi:MAG: sensor N-terminal transmembrane domain-containing protein [Rhodospirillales bacterium]|nr:sensor N-terminal transmembrane domain-containing protein [Rhodospirillales bacterium]
MASDTNTNKPHKKIKDRKFGGLTARILAVNLIVPVIFVIALLYLDDYHKDLIQTEQTATEQQAALIATALSLSNTEVETLLDRFSRQTNSHLQLYNTQGKLIAEANALPGPSDKNTAVLKTTVRLDNNKRGIETVHMTRDSGSIDTKMNLIRFRVMAFFYSVLSLTILLSVYLAWIIANPLQRLARASERIRRGGDRETVIPDLSRRGDEIGALSVALRDMTQALWDRMDSIERFAADVAHELKNPLTSLHSAVETLGKVKTENDRQRLTDIIHHDVRRLDRLITDISEASRLDSALSREEMGIVDISALLETLIRPYQTDNHHKILFPAPETGTYEVRGNEGRLAQIFDNLIGNALSFSPPDGTVTINLAADKQQITITVSDEGSGIPENKKEEIFERFYTERPGHEEYGRHSGLGLSIARQIVTAHKGEIQADNIRNAAEQITGARFTVKLNKA